MKSAISFGVAFGGVVDMREESFKFDYIVGVEESAGRNREQTRIAMELNRAKKREMKSVASDSKRREKLRRRELI